MKGSTVDTGDRTDRYKCLSLQVGTCRTRNSRMDIKVQKVGRRMGSTIHNRIHTTLHNTRRNITIKVHGRIMDTVTRHLVITRVKGTARCNTKGTHHEVEPPSRATNHQRNTMGFRPQIPTTSNLLLVTVIMVRVPLITAI